MKKIFGLIMILTCMFSFAACAEEDGVSIDEEHFPDPFFRAEVLQYDRDRDGILSPAEAENATEIQVVHKEAVSLRGIEYLTGLEELYCYNNNLTELDVSRNPKLVHLDCSKNQLTTLDISGCAVLTELVETTDATTRDNAYLWRKPIGDTNSSDISYTYLVLDRNVKLCFGSEWKDNVMIDEEHFPDPSFRTKVLQYDLDGDGVLSPAEADNATKIRAIDDDIVSLRGIEYLTGLEDLYCFDNNLTELDVSRNKYLHTLNCANNNLTELDVSQNSQLWFLHCGSNRLSALDVSGNSDLQILSCFDTQIKELDLSNLTKLAYLLVSDCELTKLDISNNPDLKELDCSGNRLTTLDLSNNIFMDHLSCNGNNLTELDISNCANLLALTETVQPGEDTGRLIWDNNPKQPDHSPYYSACLAIDQNVKLYAEEDPDPGVPIDAQNFPDEAFREEVKQFDLNGNGFLSSKEASIVSYINLSEKNISSLAGIEYLTGLRELYCDHNSLTELDLSGNTELTWLFCDYNQLTKLDISHNTKLKQLACENNTLTELDLSSNSELILIICDENKLSELDISHCPVILDLVKKRKPNPGLGFLIWEIYESVHGRNDYSMLIIDQNVKLYTGTEATP